MKTSTVGTTGIHAHGEDRLSSIPHRSEKLASSDASSSFAIAYALFLKWMWFRERDSEKAE